MPSVRYYNQTAPFWDFVAGLEEQGAQHPFSGGSRQQGDNSESETEQPQAWGWGGFPFGPMPHRGRHGPHGHRGGPGHHPHHHGGPSGPPPPQDDQEMPAPPAEDPAEAGPSEPRGPPPPGPGPHPHHGGHRHHGPHGPGPFGRRGGWGGRGRGCGRRAMGGPFGGLAEMFQAQLFGDQDETNNKSEDFTPDVDVFDTAEAFVIHVSLAGAKKEDVGVNWDAEKSELNIAGVVYRPGDEEFLKTLAMDERKVGAFERKVRLGSRANPAQVDIDGINARLEDGVLRVEVPKLDSGFVEIKKVDIE